jgi:hypothetical protein
MTIVEVGDSDYRPFGCWHRRHWVEGVLVRDEGGTCSEHFKQFKGEHMTTTIKAAEIKEGYIIEVGDLRVVVTEVFDQGPGLGLAVSGRNIADAKNWSGRFIDDQELVERIHSEDQDDDGE